MFYTWTVGTLGAGGSNTGRSAITIPSTVATGSYYLGAIVDLANAMTRTNEANNVKVDTGRLKIS